MSLANKAIVIVLLSFFAIVTGCGSEGSVACNTKAGKDCKKVEGYKTWRW